jgi:hypothetical protein
MQPPWPSSSFPRKRESRGAQLGCHNKRMKMDLFIFESQTRAKPSSDIVVFARGTQSFFNKIR